MPSRLQETLKEKAKARLRSSNNLVSREVQVHLSEVLNEETLKNHKVLKMEIVHPEGEHVKKDQADLNKLSIPLSDISDVKVKNFTEKLINIYVVAITCDEVQHFLEFDTLEKRDDWGNGLRSLHHANVWTNKRTEAKADVRKLHLIKAINLQLPRHGCILSMEIETAAGRKADLDVLDRPDKYDSTTCKELTHDFVLQNFIVPAEGASLYRFLKSVISRIIMERETTTILAEIDASRFNKVVEARKSSSGSDSDVSQIRALLHDAEAKLRDLNGAVPDRIGRHGPSSQLLVDILLRSIEKTKIYNRMAFAVNYGQTGEEIEF